jgi:hypothetical protein
LPPERSPPRVASSISMRPGRIVGVRNDRGEPACPRPWRGRTADELPRPASHHRHYRWSGARTNPSARNASSISEKAGEPLDPRAVGGAPNRASLVVRL